MAHPLISTIVIALALAWVFGALAHRLRLPPLVGYLLAGVLIGPATPGFVADQTLASELAEIGVILLMFGVGLHFSLEDLLSVRAIAVPGAIAQIACATLLGMALGHWLGWSIGAGLVFGLALSVASTVVLLRALQERRLVETGRGRIAVGWLIVEDMVMVLALVLLPAFAGVLGGEGAGTTDLAGVATAAALTIGKVAAFVAIMLIVGKRLIPWVLHYMAHTGSRELFRLAVFVIALGVAFGAAELFGVSFALGAFFAGMILSESPLSQRAAEETLPLRDAFAVLFFVSVGMLFDPRSSSRIRSPCSPRSPSSCSASRSPPSPSSACSAIPPRPRCSSRSASRRSASSPSSSPGSASISGCCLSAAATSSLPAPSSRSCSIRCSSPGSTCFRPGATSAETPRRNLSSRGGGRRRPRAGPPDRAHTTTSCWSATAGSAASSAKSLAEKKVPLLVIESDDERLAELKAQGVEAIAGNAADPEIIAAANLGAARCLLVAIPDAFEGGQVVEQARALNPKLTIIARAHSEAEVLHLKKHGASVVILGEHEIARAMVELVSPGGS